MMSTDELVQSAIKLNESTGYVEATIREKIEAGLAVGDAVYSGAQRMVYLGDGRVRMDRQAGTEWTPEREIQLNDAQMEAVLVQVAAQRGRPKVQVGCY
jgi:hypothetical protein